MTQDPHTTTTFHGPKCWVLSAVIGLCLGFLWGWVMPARTGDASAHHEDASRIKELVPGEQVEFERLPGGLLRPWSDAATTPTPSDAHAPDAHDHHHAPPVPIVLCAPFALLLLSIALMPFVSAKFWHRHYPDFALALGGVIAGYYLMSFGEYGRHALTHALIEYYSFIALIGGLFIVSGGILVRVNVRATPGANTALLAVGAVLANIVGTTGASVLLIRPFIRMNAGRLHPLHIVMFIFIVSNCGGCLTPIGDPPLYLGYLKGVPFEWTLLRLWPMWGMCIGLLLTIFFIIDSRIGRGKSVDSPVGVIDGAAPSPPISIGGASAIFCLALMVAGVFIDPMLKRFAAGTLDGIPIGATFQIIVAIVAYLLARPDIHRENDFNFHPVKEVGLLFVGIFLTMIPALGYLAANAGTLGVESPTQYYFFTGALSAMLDNAPTYLNFGQAALGLLHLPLDVDGLTRFLTNEYEVVHADGGFVRFQGESLLVAISLGAVFFGAMTYIGNGPNFMVKAISESAGVRMPSFFGYLGYAVVILLPVLIAVWAVFIR